MASRSAREVAYETIRSRIITMDLKPGDELNDRELAQELGISRTPFFRLLLLPARWAGRKSAPPGGSRGGSSRCPVRSRQAAASAGGCCPRTGRRGSLS